MNDHETLIAAWAHFRGALQHAECDIGRKGVGGPRLWLETMRQFAFRHETKDQRVYRSTAFDHEYNPELTPTNCSTLVAHAEGRAVGCIIVRVYPPVSLEHLLQGRLWMSPTECLTGNDFVPEPLPADWPTIEGRFVQRGGLYVAPDWRDKGIGITLSWLALVASFKLYEADHSLGLRKGRAQSRADLDKTVARQAVIGSARIGTPRMPFSLTHISRREALERFRGFLLAGDDQPVRSVTCRASV